MARKEDKKIFDGHIHSPNIVDNWIFCLEKDQETGFSQVVGIEFNENGEFTSKVFNQDDEYWYADAAGLHCVICEANAENAMLNLVFEGKLVENYGESDQSIIEKYDMQGAIPAWLIYDPYYDINQEHSYLYSSPYGYMVKGDEDGKVYLNLHRQICYFTGLYGEGSRTEEMVNEWIEKSGKTE